MLYGSWLLFGTIERSFSPRTMERQVALYIDTPRHFTVEQKADLHEDIFERLMEKKEELEIKDITYRYQRGSGRSRGGGPGWGRKSDRGHAHR